MGCGTVTAGSGSFPFHILEKTRRFMASLREKATVGRVNRLDPNRASCKIPIMGKEFCGEIICCGIDAIIRNSIADSTDCGICIFISIFSKMS
jgi:hypothetical protein